MYNRTFFNPKELNEMSESIEASMNHIKLKQHQKTLLKRCTDIELLHSHKLNNVSISTSIGIISDMPGSGKSYVILSLLIANKQKYETKYTMYAKNKILIESKTNNVLNVNVIVVPHNIFFQWQTYINNFKSFTFYSLSKTSHIDTFENNIKNDPIFLTNIDIILVTVGFYNNLYNVLKKYNIVVNRLIIDEADNINVSLNNEIDNSFLWVITPSYRNLLHPYGSHTLLISSTGESNSQYHSGIKKAGFIRNIFTNMVQLPNVYLENIIAKNDDNYVIVSLNLPDINYNTIKCRSPTYVTILQGIVNNAAMKSLNALDIKQYLSTNEDIVHKYIRIYTIEIQNLNAKIDYLNKLQETSEKEKKASIVKINENIEIINKKIIDIRERISNSKQCYICYNDFQSKTVLGCCLNSTCYKCIEKWCCYNVQCPICKADINKDSINIIGDGSIDEFNDFMYTKNENLLKLLQKIAENQNRKVIIFSLSDASLDNIALLLNNKYNFNYLKGNINTINNIIHSFQNDSNLKILLANPEFYGCGLNLEMTTDIIMFHKFDSDIEHQVIGRAQRLGRTDALNVHYLLHENEL